MLYVGLDVSGKSIVAYAVNERKRCVFEGERASSRAGLRALVQQVGAGAKLIEAGNQLKWIAETLKRLPAVHVHVVHPNEVKWITASRGKTDRVDAKKLAELARADLLPRAVQVVEGPVRELRELVSARQQLQRKRVALINTIRGYVYQEGHRLPEKFFAGTMWATKLARLPVSAPLKLIIETFMTSIEALVAAEQRLTARLKAIEDPRCRLLETIPAIGPLSARVLLSALDDARRFDDQKAVAHYGALTPHDLSEWGDPAAGADQSRWASGDPTGPLAMCPYGGADAQPRGEAIATVLRAHRPTTREEDRGGGPGAQAADHGLWGAEVW